ALVVTAVTWLGIRHEVRSEALERLQAEAGSIVLAVEERLRVEDGSSPAALRLSEDNKTEARQDRWGGPPPLGSTERIHSSRPVKVKAAALNSTDAPEQPEYWRSGAFGFGFGVILAVGLATVLLWVQKAGRRREIVLSRDRAELAAKTHQLEATLAGMTDGIMMVDSDLRLLEWNDHFPEFVGVPADTLRVGLPLEDILRAQARAGEFGAVDVEAEVARRMALIRGGRALGTIVRTRPNGNVLELRRNGLPAGGFVTLYTDITARRRAEERMQEAQKMAAVGRLTAGVAHDFNNLLASIMGSAELIERHLNDDATQARRLGIILNSAQRGANLVRQLLAFSRKQPLELIAVDLNAIVRGMSDLLRSTLGGAVQVETKLAQGLWPALVDPVQIEHVILNLAINSRDAMPSGGILTISTAKVTLRSPSEMQDINPGEYVTVTVSDTGTGMSQEVRRNAFDPFFTTKPVGKGSGLGLSQVYGVASQSGGGVSLSSQEGHGTTVTVYLPRAPVEASTVPLEKAGSRNVSNARGAGAVLLVEDEADVRETIAGMLRDAGFTPIMAAHGGEALAILQAGRTFDLLLVDLVMPGMDGLEVASAIRTDRPGIPVVFLTGYREDTRLEGERFVLSKPFFASTLTETLRHAMQLG
ncbi:MAG: PAS-domain containing protein, partial [Acetobacteraceae bacterium]|nr:PAS-domain containing protein [Acetobacteraceae bacterium]